MFCNDLLVFFNDGFRKLNLRRAESVILYQLYRKKRELCFVPIFKHMYV